MLMKLLGTVIGSAICGALVYGIWPEMWKSYGIMGGWLAATVLIAIAWYMNHWLGTIKNPEGTIWIDQGWAVGFAGVAWGIVRFRGTISDAFNCLPTLICCLIGGALAGVVAAHVKKTHPAYGGADSNNQD